MPSRIPIKTAKAVGEAHPDVSQVILTAWDGKRTHVVTWGRTAEDCDMAAQGGDMLKEAFGWPERLRNVEPSRIRSLRKRVADLEAENARLRATEVDDGTH